jgi:transposase
MTHFRYRLTIKDVTEIRRQWSANMPAADIAARFDISPGCIYHHCKDIKRPKQTAGRKKACNHDKVRELIGRGHTLSEVSSRFGIRRESVWRIVKAAA